MKKKIVLPSLFVLNAFLVGFAPKTSKDGSVTTSEKTNTDSVSYRLNPDSSYWSMQNLEPKIGKQFAQNADSVKNDAENFVSYSISWRGGEWVKYTADDGSGFIRVGGSRTWRNMNPGAMRHGDFSRQYGACGSAGGFAVFPTEKQGMEALSALLQTEKYSKLTIGAAIYRYSPPADNNNTKLYQQKLSKMTGLSLNKKMSDLTSEELDKVVQAIRTIEGWKSGKEENFKAPKEMLSANLKQTKILTGGDFYQKTL